MVEYTTLKQKKKKAVGLSHGRRISNKSSFPLNQMRYNRMTVKSEVLNTLQSKSVGRWTPRLPTDSRTRTQLHKYLPIYIAFHLRPLTPLPHLHPLTRQKYTGTPAATNAQTTSDCSGELNTLLEMRNKLTQQKMSGVVIHVL